MRLYALQYGKTLLPARMAFPDGAPDAAFPIALLFFLLELDDGRRALIDVGCDTMPGFALLEHRSPVEVLEELGVRRDAVTDVYLTHSHHDHIDAARYYPQATVHLHESELEAARSYLGDCSHIVTFSDGLTISDGIELRHVGGHSPGSSIVLIHGADETVVLCGDECYLHDNLTRGIPTASSYCPACSRGFIEEYRKGGYRTVLFHDPELVGEMGAKRIL